MKLTVFHDGQFWIGVVEAQDRGKLKAARHIFGKEPQDEEILEFIRYRLDSLLERLTQEVAVKPGEPKRVSPKRLARQAAAELNRKGASTFAQEAIRLEYEQRKRTRKLESREQREAEQARLRELKVRKAKEKHRGH
ncbi:MAG: YjdF family protein [Paenibacillus sp.]|jgi:hypothetical protein|uniref:YjdF family protein n=1 Tax=Paenibacillus sp. TaxID=58172 RepID=UPI0028FE9644|nr:YjdF family protein [Paenibacillus sp.]MDU2239331.1 YjdF family protein [Paenibacillus sp.]